MTIVILGAHPDDPESGCGGLAILAAQQGHRVVFVYASSGAPGHTIGTEAEAVVREQEARAACKVCGVEPGFLEFPCGDIPFSQAAVTRVSDLMREYDTDLVLTHWPVDTHPDHQAVGALGTQVVVGNPEVALAFFEVCHGIQSLAFVPNRFVDITKVSGQKKQACECHASQNVPVWWELHETMGRFRHAQACGYTGPQGGHAEAYYLAVSTPQAETLFQSRKWLQPSGSRNVRKSRHGGTALPEFTANPRSHQK